MLKYTQLCRNYVKLKPALLFNQTNVLMQQNRNTFILRRKYQVPLYKKYQKYPRLTHKHFIYELVEDTDIKPQKCIDIVLLETIKGVGIKGQKVTVKSQKAYETLILPKLAVYATPENLKKYIIEEQDIDKLSYSSPFIERTINLLAQCYLPIRMSIDIPWTIEKWHVRVSFRVLGYIVPEDAITLPKKTISGPDLSIENKEFYIIVKINNQEEVKVRCKIFHYSSNEQKKIKYDVPLYELPNIPIFAEDEPILNSLPKHRLFKMKL
ncbi:PREDICTED: 39S ribosomal protein L9, mitochondrial [Eufriesea mexicana]|uniref:39S ribosomal protein L9, mitochondrial n=1 Tax=Eufriesea mexicana TaxID=516756 RepID=UPI00083C4247|nr:PREDICTED: 39S ribosomal protein L9, mitochondrial [Eufriesea mexicana]